MESDLIPIANVELGEEEIESATDVLRSGYLVQGEQVERFEREFAEAPGANHAVAVSSGTAALHVAYLALLEPGQEVLVPSFTHVSTASTVEFAGGTPVFCDVDEETFTVDVRDAEERVTGDTAAVAPVHLFGNACDVEEVLGLAERYGLSVVWDSAQAHGTRYGGRDIGSYRDVACYSFYPTKNMTTTEGGMITTDNPEVAERCRLLRSHWQTEKYLHPNLGLNYRMTDVEAAIGRVQLKALDGFVERRRENAAYLTEGLSGVDGVTPQRPTEGADHSYNQYTVALDTDGVSREAFRASLRESGIGTAVHYPRPVHRQPAFSGPHEALPTSEALAERVVSLPVYPQLTDAELDRVLEAVERAL